MDAGMERCVGMLVLCVGCHDLALVIGERKKFVAADLPEFNSGIFDRAFVAGGHQRLETGQIREQSILALQRIQALHFKIMKCCN